MAGIGNWLENNALNWALNAVAATRPVAWNVGLHTGDPGEDGTANESAATAYARQSAAAFAAAAGGLAANSDAQTFTTSDAGEETITHITVWDTAGPNILFKGPLAVTRQFSTTKPIVLNAGDIVCSLD